MWSFGVTLAAGKSFLYVAIKDLMSESVDQVKNSLDACMELNKFAYWEFVSVLLSWALCYNLCNIFQTAQIFFWIYRWLLLSQLSSHYNLLLPQKADFHRGVWLRRPNPKQNNVKGLKLVMCILNRYVPEAFCVHGTHKCCPMIRLSFDIQLCKTQI